MVQDLHNSEISVNFLPGMDNVLVTVSICIPKQVTEVSADPGLLIIGVKTKMNYVYWMANQYISDRQYS